MSNAKADIYDLIFVIIKLSKFDVLRDHDLIDFISITQFTQAQLAKIIFSPNKQFILLRNTTYVRCSTFNLLNFLINRYKSRTKFVDRIVNEIDSIAEIIFNWNSSQRLTTSKCIYIPLIRETNCEIIGTFDIRDENIIFLEILI